ncbi:MAG: glutathione S-transferase, partial [Nostoc sp.]
LPASIRGKGLPIFTENIDYAPFFTWRDRLYTQFRKPLIITTPPTGGAPTSIQID